MLARKQPDKSKSPYDFEVNKRLLQPIWDQFKADLAKYGVRPWDRFEEKDNHGDNHFSIGQAVWDLPCGKRAVLDYVSHCGRPDEFIFWPDFDHIKGRYEPGPTEGLTPGKAIEEIRKYFLWIELHMEEEEGAAKPVDFKRKLQTDVAEYKEKIDDALTKVLASLKEYKIPEDWDDAGFGEDLEYDGTVLQVTWYRDYTRYRLVVHPWEEECRQTCLYRQGEAEEEEIAGGGIEDTMVELREFLKEKRPKKNKE